MSSTSSCLRNTLVLRIMSCKTIKEKPKKERTDRRTLSLLTDPHASLLNSQEKHHLIVLVLDPQKNFRPSSSSSSLLQFASEKEKKKKKSLHLPQLQTKKRTLFSHNGASGPVRRVSTPQADLHIRFSSAHQARLVWYSIARLSSTRVCSNNDPPS